MNLNVSCKDSGSPSLHFGLVDKASPAFLGSGVLSLLLSNGREERDIHVGVHLRGSTEGESQAYTGGEMPFSTVCLWVSLGLPRVGLRVGLQD